MTEAEITEMLDLHNDVRRVDGADQFVLVSRVFNSGRLGVNTPKNFSPYAQILKCGRHDVQINLLLIAFVYNKLEIEDRICFPMFR